MSDEKKKRTHSITPEVSVQQASARTGESEEFTIDLYELLLKLVEKWYWVALSGIACMIAMLLYTNFFVTPQYKATSKIYVRNNKGSVLDVSDLQISNYLTNDYKEVFNNWHVHEAVNEKLGLDYSYSKLRSMLSISNPTNTRILYITATSTDPKEAQNLANAYAEVAREFISVKMDTSEPTSFEEALLPSAPSSPNRTRNAFIGLVLGCMIAVGIITARYLMDDYIRTEEDVEKYLHLPVLGMMMLQKDDTMTESDTSRRSKAKGGQDDE